ncbi:hypothetical protein AAEP93_004293 [Penicillium crustosum]
MRVEIRRRREEREEGHRSARWCFDRESGETTDRISSIAMSTRQNQWEKEWVGKKWLVGARDRSAPPEGGGAEIDHRTPPESVTIAQRRDWRPRKANVPITVVLEDTETLPSREK